MHNLNYLQLMAAEGEIYVDGDIRRKRVMRNDKLKSIALCNGKNNTCLKQGVIAGKCKLCTAGLENRAWLQQYDDNEDFIKDGKRMVRKGRRAVRYCVGEDDTCTNIVNVGTHCVGCTNGNKRTVTGRRYKTTGTRRRRLCSGLNDTCDKLAKRGAYCIAHSE